MFCNVTAHARRNWPTSKSVALDPFTALALIHRRFDQAALTIPEFDHWPSRTLARVAPQPSSVWSGCSAIAHIEKVGKK